MITQLKSLANPANVTVAYLVLIFLLGGGARDDLASLVFLRPISVAVLGYALFIAKPERLRANRMLLGLAASWTALTAVHLVPLPPSIWHNLPGRELAVSIDAAVGLESHWRPISLVPYRTLNSLLSLTIPLAVLVLALNLTREQLRTTAYTIAALGLVSLILGLLQVVGGSGNAFYTYRITNGDSAVGLFANRNHNAVMMALLIVSISAAATLITPPRELDPIWRPLVVGIALGIIPILILTQSRAGLVLGVFALAAAYWVQIGSSSKAGRGKASDRSPLLLIAGGIGALALALATYALTADNSLARLGHAGGADDELRLRIWPTTLELVIEHFPVGSGVGTFVEVFEAAEPASTLGQSYINHAHNDFLEVAMTGGLPALAIMIMGVIWLAAKGFRGLRASKGRDRTLRKLGLVTLGLMVLGSLYDYPLRTPSLATVFILGLVWIAGHAPTSSPASAPRRCPTSSPEVRRWRAQTGLKL